MTVNNVSTLPEHGVATSLAGETKRNGNGLMQVTERHARVGNN